MRENKSNTEISEDDVILKEFLAEKPQGKPKTFRFLQGLYKNNLNDTNEDVWKQYLTDAMKTDHVDHEGKTWFRFGKKWTYAEAREHNGPNVFGNSRYVDFWYAVF